MRIILASSSPRRKELLEKFNLSFEIIPSNSEEVLVDGLNKYEQCENIAYHKALDIYNQITGDVIVIGSDTVVLMNNKVYMKPKNYDDAFKMLSDFSSNVHEVISSLCVLVRKNGHEYKELTHDKCRVFVSSMSNNEIKNWINNHDVYTRAGAYAIQDGFFQFVEKVEGDYFSIVGLPVHKLYNILKKYDVIE